MLRNKIAAAFTAIRNHLSKFQVRRGLPHKTSKPSAIDHKTKPPAHSIIPTNVLLRSLLVTTISSNWILRVPSLSILMLLTKAKGPLFNVDRNPFIHGFLKRTLYDHFCAGEVEGQVRDTIRQLKDTGLRGVILTYARETTRDDRIAKQKEESNEKVEALERDEMIQAWTDGVLRTIDMIDEGDYLALKLTGAGPQVNQALTTNTPPPPQMLEALDEICRRVVQKNARILMDAEQRAFLDGIYSWTLDLMRKYNRDGRTVVYNTYQAYLKATPDVIATHMQAAGSEGFILGLKLVRGAYMGSDPRNLIHDTKEETDTAYDTIVQSVLSRRFMGFGGENAKAFPPTDLFLASHNYKSVMAAHHLHQTRMIAQLPTVNVEYGQLMGMADGVSYGLLQVKGHNNMSPGVYKCLTWGSLGECLQYLVRRAMENQDAVARTDSEHQALKAEVKRRFLGVLRG
ncbi:proline dehydrogenase family protein [Aspergillus glaucus CBS 516.65]|uniref:Proline dehydrogenase n=1 Tax=Aspergillus glaucus CBS 516.65 TaxID=1160497 RepID=A0A1L9VXE3_ASPGL|nr:hypothetical protein ASPGLDRAFT_63439 [Aspergillus glaucus CBS 516.65]OJJ88581.1 hypothetical protein ASPGLDRAFT_63439 [Aspergillus glaucus CBS 516.65]